MNKLCPHCKARIKISQFMYLQINDYKITCPRCQQTYAIDKFVYYIQLLVLCVILVLIGHNGPSLIIKIGLNPSAQNFALLLLLPLAIVFFIYGQSCILSFWINKRY